MKKKRMTSGILASAMMISALSLPMCVFAEEIPESESPEEITNYCYETNSYTDGYDYYADEAQTEFIGWFDREGYSPEDVGRPDLDMVWFTEHIAEETTRIPLGTNGNFTCDGQLYKDVIDYDYQFYNDGSVIVTATVANNIEDIELPDSQLDFGKVGITTIVSDLKHNSYSLEVMDSEEFVGTLETSPVEMKTYSSYCSCNMRNFSTGDNITEQEEYDKHVDNIPAFTQLTFNAEDTALHAGDKLFQFSLEVDNYNERKIFALTHSGTTFLVEDEETASSLGLSLTCSNQYNENGSIVYYGTMFSDSSLHYGLPL